MEMGTTLVGCIIIIICTLPFVLIKRNKNKREGELLKSLNNIAEEYEGEIHHYEINGNFAIGLDEVKDFVFFSKHIKDDAIEEICIDLLTFKKCVLNRANSSEMKINRLSLNFSPIDSNQPIKEIEFFNDTINVQLNDELQIIERWFEFINNRLKLINR